MAMAAEQSSDNPFSPGTGFVPEHLAGREPEQALLRQALGTIIGPRKGFYGPLRSRAPQPLKIIGARGVGKTTLLAWAEREAEPLKADVVRLAFLPGAKTKEVIAGFRRQLATVPGLRKIEAQAFKYIQMALNWQPGQSSVMDFGELLATRLRFRPLLLLLDEVMHHDPKMLGGLLQQSQVLMSQEWPLAVVLAGTPALNVHLQEVDATFINRAKNIRINGLEPAATREAFSKPFADRGIALSDEALELMVSWTDDYPYFIQIVGSEVWKAKKDAEVDVALVRSVEQAVQKERNDSYGSIYHIISKAKLLEPASKAVAAIEAAPEPLDPEEVTACLEEGTDLKGKDPSDVYDKLLDAGLFWEREDGEVHAAIPSFFTYFKKRYKQGRKRAKPSS